MKPCAREGREKTHKRRRGLFCSDACRYAHHNERKRDHIGVPAVRNRARELASGKLRVWIDIDPKYKHEFLTRFPDPGAVVEIIATKEGDQ